MSTENRLARLGLLHLIDKPEELLAALNERLHPKEEPEIEIVDGPALPPLGPATLHPRGSRIGKPATR